MFVSHASSPGPGKMKFRKPNILRKKPKCHERNIPSGSEDIVTLTPINASLSPRTSDIQNFILNHNIKPNFIKTHQKIKLDSYDCEARRSSEKSTAQNIKKEEANAEQCTNNNGYTTIVVDSVQADESSTNITYMALPVEALLLHGDTYLIPASRSLLAPAEAEPPIPDVTSFKCDFGDCKKEFNSKQKLKKHKARHSKDCSKTTKQPISCPAKKPRLNGEVEAVPCDKVFSDKKDLVSHLKNDHTIEDAAFSCPECVRGFFWASGVRAHRRACGAGAPRRAPLACPWEGCGRVFLQPCRLKEHCRAHTGDRPYPCLFPNCGWSFRTASKLLRHRRKHTGERRHRCAECGARFLRREHLREHATRHARATPAPRRAPRPHARHRDIPCRYLGCKQKFIDVQSRDDHIKTDHLMPLSVEHEEHATTNEVPIQDVTIEQEAIKHEAIQQVEHIDSDWGMEEDPFMPAACSSRRLARVARGAREARGGGRAARTHCTWPLAATTDADVNVELSEGSESNASTIRSDLFLHGNVLPNDDNDNSTSEQGAGAGTLLHHDMDALGLLHDHPTDLMQDALMYTDAAVDESSFQVLLLSDTDLNS